MVSGARQPVLAALAAVVLAGGLGLVLAVAIGRVEGARVGAAGAEARMAAALWEEGGSNQAVAGLLGERATILGAGDGGGRAGAYAFEAGALDPAAWIAVEPRRTGGPWAAFPGGAVAIALAGTALIAGWAATRRRGATGRRYPTGIALLSIGCVALTTITAGRWADCELRALSAATVAQGARAVGLAMATGADPARAARVAHLPWAEDRSLEAADEQWTMPPGVAAAIAARPDRGVARPAGAPTGTPYTVEADGATWHAARAGAVHLAFLGHEHTASPFLPLAAAGALAALLVALALHLAQLAARPRALRRTLAAWGLLAPAAALILAFTLGPLLFSLWISLHEWRLIDPAPFFLGLDNYATLLGDGE